MALWQPLRPEHTESSRFIEYVNTTHKSNLRSYDDLYQYSITRDDFWRIAIKDTYVPSPKFFPNVSLNYAENCLEHGRDDAIAVISAREGATTIKKYTFRELKSHVHRLVDALQNLGVRQGDRVAGVLTNSIFTVSLMLASASIGAVYSSTATDMGVSGILDRLNQILPTNHDLLNKASEVLGTVKKESLRAFVVVPNIAELSDRLDTSSSSVFSLSDLYNRFPERSDTLAYQHVKFSDPLFIMYSSGITGPPKCIVHSTGGVLLQMRKEYALHMNLRPGDVYWQYTTTGWMMYQYLLTSLSVGVTIVCLEGSPMIGLERLLEFIAEQKVTHFVPRKLVGNLTSLRSVVSTGSVLVSGLYHHFYDTWPKHIQLATVSGGADLMSCFFMHNPITPVHAGEIQCISLGIGVKILDNEGNEIIARSQPGELVCVRPFPSQPTYFLSDPGGKIYKAAYYELYKGLWHHADFVQFGEHGGIVMLGRSDGGLNPNGVRFGSAETYSITENIPEVIDALCVGQRRPEDTEEVVVLFVMTRKREDFTLALASRIKTAIRSGLSPRHVPKYIFWTPGIPLTLNAKKIELVVKQILSGQTPKVSAAIANRETLTFYYQFRDIERVALQDKARL